MERTHRDTVADVADRPSRAKDPDERKIEPRGDPEDRVHVNVKVRRELWSAIEKHRGDKKWGTAMQTALEVGLKKLGWLPKDYEP